MKSYRIRVLNCRSSPLCILHGKDFYFMSGRELAYALSMQFALNAKQVRSLCRYLKRYYLHNFNRTNGNFNLITHKSET